jgi:Transposase DDE domain
MTCRASTASAKTVAAIPSFRCAARRRASSSQSTAAVVCSPHIARRTDRFRALYRRRALVEKEFAHLKREHALTQVRVRGLERVQLHADLVLLARLALASSRMKALSVAAYVRGSARWPTTTASSTMP